MQKDELAALAERVQALTGSCRETDEAIALSVGWRQVQYGPEQRDIWKSPCGALSSLVPAFTASLDAAMTLAKTDAEACAVLHEAMDALSRDCPTQGNWRAHLPRYVVAEVIRVRLAQVQP